MRNRFLLILMAITLLAASCSGSDSGSTPEATDGADTTEATPETTEPTETTNNAPETTEGEPEDIASPLTLTFLHAEPDPINGGAIVDEDGREWLLRGTNVNAYAEYWSGNDFPTVNEFREADADRIAEVGWNVVRLLFTWSLAEPEPGVYDEVYLDELEGVVDMLAERGIYTVLDSHQDAWGATLAARPDEVCGEGQEPANGWDGAPEWATLVDDATPRCTAAGLRETSAAVREANIAFFANDEGPGGVGIRTRYADMWGHIGARFANHPAVAGYDLMNEPNAFSDEEQRGLVDMYSEALAAIRASEKAEGGQRHLVLFEPFALWSSLGAGAPPQWDYDDDVVYAPHIYTGAFNDGPITREAFEVAVAEAAAFGGAPILSGEWGWAAEVQGEVRRTGPDGDGYFLDHQKWQDEFHIAATLWEYHESCGDPHKVNVGPIEDQIVAGIYDVDCATNEIVGEREELVDEMTRAYPWAAPGLDTTLYDPATGALEVSGSDATIGVDVLVFYPTLKHGNGVEVTSSGLGDVTIHGQPGGTVFITAPTTEASWTLSLAPGE